MKYELVIGLEVHAELSTKTKIFCACSAHSFGASPNTQICPVCCGMAGALPRLNRAVVEYAMRAGMMLSCRINRTTAFDRKSYFYPDLPAAYQITQATSPIAVDGCVEIETASGKKTVRIKQIHMEEDAGKLVHDIKEGLSHVDYNRAGVPLIEIVSEPDIHSGEEAQAYLERLRTLLRYARVSECEMAHGTMRCDVNLSVRPEGSSAFGVRTELKNMNSIAAIRRAIDYEAGRHIDAIERGDGTLRPETRRWDEERGVTLPMRSKETAGDYRYAPEPNLMPLTIDDDWCARIRASLPEFPEHKRARYTKDYGLGDYEAQILTRSIAVSECFEGAYATCKNAKEAANWVISEVLALLNAGQQSADALTLDGARLGEVILLVLNGTVGRANAKKILAALLEDPDLDPAEYVKQHGFVICNDAKEIEDVVRFVLAENPRAVADYKGGKEKALMSLYGACMKALRGNCDPLLLKRILSDEIRKI